MHPEWKLINHFGIHCNLDEGAAERKQLSGLVVRTVLSRSYAFR